MKSKIVESPKRKSASNRHWLKIAEQFENLSPGKCIQVTGLTSEEINALRQQARREKGARSFQRIEKGEPVLYLYKR